MSVLIIAEAGVNHNGSVDLAKALIREAKSAGADIIKFQTGKSEKVASRFAQKADYQKENTGSGESQLDMIKKLELSYDQFRELKDYSDHIGITFLSTPFDLESVDFLNELGLTRFKIPSGEINNLPYLLKIAKLKKEVIMSTGMSYMHEIQTAVDILRQNGAENITLLHCNTEYPTPYHDVNLRAILSIRDRFHLPVGYSDHTPGIEISIAAVALGAVVIEKHLTLDRNMEGPDHRASIEPSELAAMVRSIRNIEAAMGSGVKEPSPSERNNIIIARRSIVAARHINAGEAFSGDNLVVKRPGNGISPLKWFELQGHIAGRDYEEDELIDITEI